MFILTKIADLVQVAPNDFKKLSSEAIQDNINAKYSNKIIQKIGLCICLWDILWTSEGLIGHGDGFANINVEFRMVVFRPFQGEVLVARIGHQMPEGINLRIPFFHDIFVPANELPEGSEYSTEDGLWVWKVDDQVLYFDENEMVRFSVLAEEWHDQAPNGPLETEQPVVNLTPPYKITGSMKVPGLGCSIWWD